MKLNYKTTAIATALVLGLTGCQTVAKKPVTQPVATVNANTTTTPTTNNQPATNTVTTPAIPKQFVIFSADYIFFLFYLRLVSSDNTISSDMPQTW